MPCAFVLPQAVSVGHSYPVQQGAAHCEAESYHEQADSVLAKLHQVPSVLFDSSVTLTV